MRKNLYSICALKREHFEYCFIIRFRLDQKGKRKNIKLNALDEYQNIHICVCVCDTKFRICSESHPYKNHHFLVLWSFKFRILEGQMDAVCVSTQGGENRRILLDLKTVLEEVQAEVKKEEEKRSDLQLQYTRDRCAWELEKAELKCRIAQVRDDRS